MSAGGEKEEWAIREVGNDGRWFVAMGSNWGTSETAKRFASYSDAAADVVGLGDSVRIVPAPPREMTDAEAEEWFKTLNSTYRITYNASGNFWVQGVRDANLGSGNIEWISIGHTICDAIRAARRKLEGEK